MNRHAKKQEIADKVKEIKMRQKNWMKQRADSKEPDPMTETVEAPKASPQQVTATRKTEEPTSSINNLLTSHKSKAKFHNWLKAKETPEASDTDITSLDSNVNSNSKHYQPGNYNNNEYIDRSYRDHSGSSDVNILRVPSTRPAGYASPDTEWNSEDETGEITTAQLMSPQDFDSRADNIIAKVKGDLGLQNRHHHTSNTAGRHGSKRNDHIHGGRHSLVDTGSNKSSGSEMSNHTCPTCEKIMVAPNNPMLLIPCGHTLCGLCCRVTKFCGLCGCAVQSSTANIMLQQIITKYSDKTAQQTGKTASQSGDKGRYKEEYQNLITRQEILHEESNSVKQCIHKLKTKLSHEHEKVENILEEERMIQAKIKSLQERLRVLVEHRSEYELSCDKLHTQTKQEKNKLVLIHDSIKSIDEQMEKVRLFVEEGL